MKKIITLLGLYVLVTPYVAGWGIQIGANNKFSFLFKHAGQTSFTQPVCVQTYAAGEYFPGLPADSRVSQEQLVTEMENGLNYWFVKSRELLQQQGRTAEFADALAVLPQHVQLQIQPDCATPDTLRIIYAPRPWYIRVRYQNNKPIEVSHNTRYVVPQVYASDEIAWTETYSTGITLTIYKRLDLINLPQVLAHEAGHILGLANQYGFSRYGLPGEDMNKNFSYFNVAGKNTQKLNNSLKIRKPASLMGAKQYHAQALKTMWPDDLDGLINAIDFMQVYYRGQLSPRVVNGWKSFSLAREQVYYAFATPFKSDSTGLPDQLLARVNDYTRGEIGNLNLQDLPLLQAWYRQPETERIYMSVNSSDLHKWQTAQVTQRELQQTVTHIQTPKSTTQAHFPDIQISSLQVTNPVAPNLPEQLKGQHSEIVLTQSTLQKTENNPGYQMYISVNSKLGQFYKKYGPELMKLKRKLKANRKLTKRERKLLTWHLQLQENQRNMPQNLVTSAY